MTDPLSPEGERDIKLQLWDTAGDDKLRHITRNYYRGASAALVVYDVTNSESLTAAAGWIQSLRESAEVGCYIALVGNKVDLIEQIEVMKSEGQQFADQQGVNAFMQTSAKDGTGIEQLFKLVAESARDQRSARSSMQLKPNKHSEGKDA